MGKKGKKKKKNKQPAEPEEVIPADLKELPTQALTERIDAFTIRWQQAAKMRNNMQLEKDMVNQFYEITKTEVKQIDAELLNMDRQMEMLERDHRVHIKVHEQKVQNLEYYHKESRRQVGEDAEMWIQKEKEVHSDNVLSMNREKLDIKQELHKQQLESQEGLKMIMQGFNKSLQKLRDQFENQHKQLQEQYEQQVEQLKVDLELSRKVEIHEIEERKNQHIFDLMVNHQEAFDEIKAYYNDITFDNLNLIKSLRDDIQEMKEREKKNQKKMLFLTQENKDLSEPLEKALEKKKELEGQLKSYEKDKLALKNLKAHYKQLEGRIAEAQSEYQATEERHRKLEKEKEDLYRRFQKAVRETQHRAELGKNAVLEKKLELLTAQFDEKQAQLNEMLTEWKLDPTIVASVTKKLEQVLGSKNRQIKDLQYQVHQCTKAYNDTIRVYETKLPGLGIDPEEIGFEPIQTDTSHMPAGLVTRIG